MQRKKKLWKKKQWNNLSSKKNSHVERRGFFMPFPQELQHHISENALSLVQEYWEKYPFELRISKHRHSKSGDYRFLPKGNSHLITVNESLGQSQFLFTLVHEIAHQWVKINYTFRQEPHGKAWKDMFKKLLQPFIDKDIFPEKVRKEMIRHMKNPKASTSADPKLYYLLQDNQDQILLKDLNEGSVFEIGNKRFEKGPKRRTRFLCYSIPDRKKYTISSIAPIRLEASYATGNI